MLVLVAGACRPAPHRAPAAPPPEITIESIAAGNPLIVAGRARAFENSIAIRVRDTAGALITEQVATAAGEIGHHNPYEAHIWLVRHPGSRVTVEAFEYSAKDGSIRSLTSRSAAFPVGEIRATLVFPLGDCTPFGEFPRPLPRSTAMARLLVEALLAGPAESEKAAGASAPFPDGSAVRSVNLRDGTLTVDFNERLQNVGGSCAALAIRESVTRTLSKLPTVERVRITAGGREDLALQP